MQPISPCRTSSTRQALRWRSNSGVASPPQGSSQPKPLRIPQRRWLAHSSRLMTSSYLPLLIRQVRSRWVGTKSLQRLRSTRSSSCCLAHRTIMGAIRQETSTPCSSMVESDRIQWLVHHSSAPSSDHHSTRTRSPMQINPHLR